MNDLDRLMAELEEDPVKFGSNPANIDKIIEYQRKARAAYAAGEKPKKGIAPTITGSALLDTIGLGKPKTAEPIKRRI